MWSAFGEKEETSSCISCVLGELVVFEDSTYSDDNSVLHIQNKYKITLFLWREPSCRALKLNLPFKRPFSLFSYCGMNKAWQPRCERTLAWISLLLDPWQNGFFLLKKKAKLSLQILRLCFYLWRPHTWRIDSTDSPFSTDQLLT